MSVHTIDEHRTAPPAAFPSTPVGIGLRHPYYQEILDNPPDVGWLEAHPENFFGGGAPRHFLSEACKHYPISLHAVGLSLGSDKPVNEEHLRQFKDLIDEFNPFNISDHASWSASGNAHLNDLLPLPYTQESLNTLCRNVEQTQEYFGRSILVENPSTYVAFTENEMGEAEFMNRIAESTGCGILLDINNIFVQAFNHGYDAFEYIDTINVAPVGEMHLAGHTEKDLGNDQTILIDTHNRNVRSEVWDLYEYAVRKFTNENKPAVPTLIEWDQDFPTLNELVAEANRAKAIIEQVQTEAASHAAK